MTFKILSMKHPGFHIIPVLCFLWLSLSGCIHTYPDGDGIDPTLVQLGVEVSIDIDWQPIEVALTKADDIKDCTHRLIIEFNRNGKLHGRCEHLLSEEEYAKGNIKLIMPFDFNAVTYDISAWLDCLVNDNNENFYNTSSLAEITRNDNHIVWTDVAECAFASTSVNLQEYKDQWNAKVVVPITLTSPIARFEFVATDFSEFYDFIAPNIGKGETYTVCLAFECRIAKAFNAAKNEGATYLSNPEYYFSLSPPEIESSGGKIICGSIFLGDRPQTIQAKVLVFNSARMIVSKSPTIQFSVERGKITKITGDMLTDYYTGSFNINNIWDGEIIIEL